MSVLSWAEDGGCTWVLLGLYVLTVWTKPSPTFPHCLGTQYSSQTFLIRDDKHGQIFSESCLLSSVLMLPCVFFSFSSCCLSLCVLLLSDFVRVTVSLRFGDVTITARDFIFYDCMAVKQMSGSMPWVTTDDLLVRSPCLLLILVCSFLTTDLIIKSYYIAENVLFHLVALSFFVSPTIHLSPCVLCLFFHFLLSLLLLILFFKPDEPVL